MPQTTIINTLRAIAILASTLTAADGADHGTFLTASRAGDVAQVQALLADGAEVNAPDDSGNTAIHYATAYGYSEVVQILADAGADVENEFGGTAFAFASGWGHQEIVDQIQHASPSSYAFGFPVWFALLVAVPFAALIAVGSRRISCVSPVSVAGERTLTALPANPLQLRPQRSTAEKPGRRAAQYHSAIPPRCAPGRQGSQ